MHEVSVPMHTTITIQFDEQFSGANSRPKTVLRWIWASSCDCRQLRSATVGTLLNTQYCLNFDRFIVVSRFSMVHLNLCMNRFGNAWTLLNRTACLLRSANAEKR